MAIEGLNRRQFKKKIVDLLSMDDFDAALKEIRSYPKNSVINVILGSLMHPQELVRWRAVTTGGILTADLADDDMEAGRIMIRRHFWNLTEESGAFAYGAPELIGEALANHDGLAKEFGQVLISHIMPEGNFLDFEPLLKGAIWGIGRLAETQSELCKSAVPYLVNLLEEEDLSVNGFALWALKRIPHKTEELDIVHLCNSDFEFAIFDRGNLRTFKVKELCEDN